MVMSSGNRYSHFLLIKPKVNAVLIKIDENLASKKW